MVRLSSPPLVVVMGVSGVGKSAVGERLAEVAGVAYADGDAFHSATAVAAMASGRALTDDDRWPWLREIGDWLAGHAGTGGVVSCSALRRAYRDVLVERAPGCAFLHLVGDRELIAQRMTGRDHFMPLTLLESQMSTLEPLAPDENGIALDITPSPDEIVAELLGEGPEGHAR